MNLQKIVSIQYCSTFEYIDIVYVPKGGHVSKTSLRIVPSKNREEFKKIKNWFLPSIRDFKIDQILYT
jgi:hypothetical protein